MNRKVSLFLKPPALLMLLMPLILLVLSMGAAASMNEKSMTAIVETKVGKLYYKISGVGPNLLLLHGGLSSGDDFQNLLPVLSKNFRVIVVDRHGHGRSPDTGAPFSYAAMAEEMKAFLDKLGIESTAVLGWSDGGIVAYQLASRYPKLVSKLLAIGANIGTDSMPSGSLQWLRDKSDTDQLLAEMPGVADEYRRLAPQPEQLREFVRRSREMWLHDPYITTQELEKIEAKVLLIAGDNHDIPVEHLLALRGIIKQAQLCILPGASHFVLKEKPAILLPIVEDFLGITHHP